MRVKTDKATVAFPPCQLRFDLEEIIKTCTNYLTQKMIRLDPPPKKNENKTELRVFI